MTLSTVSSSGSWALLEEAPTSRDCFAAAETESSWAEEEEVEEEINIDEDINALIAGEELSEEFQEKARTIFETAIKSKVATVKEELQKACLLYTSPSPRDPM